MVRTDPLSVETAWDQFVLGGVQWPLVKSSVLKRVTRSGATNSTLILGLLDVHTIESDVDRRRERQGMRGARTITSVIGKTWN